MLMVTKKVSKITILGTGLMAVGVAQVAATSGFKVTMRGYRQESLVKAQQEVEKGIKSLATRGRATEEAAKEGLAGLSFTLDLAASVKDADLVVEAIAEDLALKQEMFREVAKHARAEALLASNTSSISITEIAKAVTHPENFVGMHFFNPVTAMKLVEVIPGEKTSREAMEVTRELSVRMGKTPVAVNKVTPGFIVNRVLVTYINEAAKLLDSGMWKREQIDAAMQFKAKMPLGPLMLADLIGLDIVYNIMRVFEDAMGSYYKPAESLRRLNEEKKLGQKSGEGYWSYKERPRLAEADGSAFPVNLLLNPFISEAEKVYAEGVADKEAIDTALKLGGNLPQGPFEYATMFTSKRFSDYLDEGRLMGTRCRKCGKLTLPPRPICPACGSEEMEWKEYKGEGKVKTYTVINVPLTALKPLAPHAMGVVQLDEGPSISGVVLDVKEGSQLNVGDRVKAEYMKEGAKTRLCFRKA